jgi:predicted RNA-binding protein YlqC (UPF0109 family)
MIRDLVEFLVRSIVDRPDAVRVSEAEEDGTLRIEVRVAAEDMGKVIGRQRRMLAALRTLARAAATRAGQGRVLVDVVD